MNDITLAQPALDTSHDSAAERGASAGHVGEQQHAVSSDSRRVSHERPIEPLDVSEEPVTRSNLRINTIFCILCVCNTNSKPSFLATGPAD